MRLRPLLVAVAAAFWLLPATAGATLFYFVIDLNGANEVTAGGVPNQGDPDGTGTATLIIDDSTTPYTVTWNITVANIVLPLSGAHIHQAPVTTTGSVVVNFSAQLSGSVQDADLAGVLANPTGYYVNLHNSIYPNGAIRGQIPEPGTALLLAGGLGLLARRSRRRDA